MNLTRVILGFSIVAALGTTGSAAPPIPAWREGGPGASSSDDSDLEGPQERDRGARRAKRGGRQRPERQWADPNTQDAAGATYHTFRSATIQGDVSYLIYLPPSYATAKKTRFPVVYWLHGGGGNPRDGAGFVERLDVAIRDGKAPPMIAVLVNGKGGSLFSDSKDGKTPVETVIVKDLIPHIDATYRTIAKRGGRAVEGFSMGGFGAFHLGFKYPDLFGVVSGLAAALIQPGSGSGKVADVFQSGPFAGDREYFLRNDPFTLATKNADRVRGRTFVRIVVGDHDSGFTFRRNRALHELLESAGIAHEYRVVPDVSHRYQMLYDKMGAEGFEFYTKAFAPPAS
jgi:endo-1,4-beta-xylanase